MQVRQTREAIKIDLTEAGRRVPDRGGGGPRSPRGARLPSPGRSWCNRPPAVDEAGARGPWARVKTGRSHVASSSLAVVSLPARRQDQSYMSAPGALG